MSFIALLFLCLRFITGRPLALSLISRKVVIQNSKPNSQTINYEPNLIYNLYCFSYHMQITCNFMEMLL